MREMEIEAQRQRAVIVEFQNLLQSALSRTLDGQIRVHKDGIDYTLGLESIGGQIVVDVINKSGTPTIPRRAPAPPAPQPAPAAPVTTIPVEERTLNPSEAVEIVINEILTDKDKQTWPVNDIIRSIIERFPELNPRSLESAINKRLNRLVKEGGFYKDMVESAMVFVRK